MDDVDQRMIAMPASIQPLFPPAPETEKITVNLGH